MTAPGVFVCGTGRSGTSLAMQALGRAGLSLPARAVPPSDTNPLGTGEAIALRDLVRRLNKAFNRSGPFRPDGWLEASEAIAAIEWLAHYFSGRAASAPEAGFADKFPAASLYLPIWEAAAERSDVPIRYVCATRHPESVIASMIRAYDGGLRRAGFVWAQRALHVLREAPDETLLLPYERWSQGPAEQTHALLAFAGGRDEGGVSTYDPSVDHSGEDPPFDREDLPQSLRRAMEAWTALIGTQRGVLADVVERESIAARSCALDLAEALLDLSPGGRVGMSQDELEIRLAFCHVHGAGSGENQMSSGTDLESFATRLQELATENRELQRKADTSTSSVDEMENEFRDLKDSYVQLNADYDELEERLAARHQAHLTRIEARVALDAKSRDLRESAKIKPIDPSKKIDPVKKKVKKARRKSGLARVGQNVARAYRKTFKVGEFRK